MFHKTGNKISEKKYVFGKKYINKWHSLNDLCKRVSADGK